MSSRGSNRCLKHDDGERHEVEYGANVDASEQFVQRPGKFVEGWSGSILNVSAMNFKLWRVMHDLSKFVVLQRFEVNRSKFHDNLKGNKMNDAMLNGMLECKELQIDKFSDDCKCGLTKSDDKRNFRAIFDETFRLIVCILHDYKTFSHLWMQIEVQSYWTRQFYKKDIKVRLKVQVKICWITYLW